METGTIWEAIEHLDKTDDVLRHRVRLSAPGSERFACRAALELVERARELLLPHCRG